MTIISIEGNIGSGKSTLLKRITETYPDVVTLQEPVDIWNTIRDPDGKTLLELYYGDQKKWAFAFQMMAFITRAKLLREAVENNPGKVIVTERSVFTDKNIFAMMLHDSGIIHDVEYSIYLHWFDELTRGIQIDRIIYVRTEPNECEWRIKCRNRSGETIPIEYLESCHRYHEDWLRVHDDKLILNGELTTEEMLNKLKTFLQCSSEFFSWPC
jgi:deoxyadenosine/deoxycytidine kinase